MSEKKFMVLSAILNAEKEYGKRLSIQQINQFLTNDEVDFTYLSGLARSNDILLTMDSDKKSWIVEKLPDTEEYVENYVWQKHQEKTAKKSLRCSFWAMIAAILTLLVTVIPIVISFIQPTG